MKIHETRQGEGGSGVEVGGRDQGGAGEEGTWLNISSVHSLILKHRKVPEPPSSPFTRAVVAPVYGACTRAFLSVGLFHM